MRADTLPFIGFDPRTIRLKANVGVVDQHAGDGAFLWGQRCRASRSPKHRLVDLARLDRRLEAHLRGLVVASGVGWDACQALLGEGTSELFPATVVALSQPTAPYWTIAVEALQAEPAAEPAFVSALAWVPWTLAEPRLRELDSSGVPLLQHAAVAGYAAHRKFVEGSFERARTSGGVRVFARALRAAGESALPNALSWFERGLRAGDPGVRLSAARSALLAVPGHAVAVATLTQLTPPAGSHGPLSEAAVDLLARALGPLGGLALYRSLADGGHSRLALLAALAGGWPEAVDSVIAHMSNARLARLAGLVFTQTTGLDLNFHDLEGEPLEDADESDDSDSLIPWPDPSRVTARWASERSRYAPRQRYLRGEALTEESAGASLRKGTQPQRRSAALELALLRPGSILYSTSRSGLEQARELLGWT